MWKAFALQKLLWFFSTKNMSEFGYKVIKHRTSWPLNELVKLTMLWTTGPWTLKWIQIAYYFQRERKREREGEKKRVAEVKSRRGWWGGAMALGKLSVPGCPTNLDNSRARAYCACSRCEWSLFGHFSLVYLFPFFSLYGRQADIDWNTVRKGRYTQNNQPTKSSHHQSIAATMFTLKFRTKWMS